MKVVITGGGGFIGRRLVEAILAKGTLATADGQQEVREIVLFDQVAAPDALLADRRVRSVTGDIVNPATVGAVMGGDTDSIFHLAAVVSAGAEADFDLGWQVNMEGTRIVLEAARAQRRPPRVFFASSIAVYGGGLPDVVTDATPLHPETSYGAQKTTGELMVNDYTRKGFIDGRAARLPTISVRPGKPNKAASGFASGIFREPLNGVDFACPVSPESCMALMSPRRVVQAIMHAHELDGARLAGNRRLLLPGIRVSMGEAVAALERVAGNRRKGRVSFEIDPATQKIVDGWPKETRSDRAAALGFTGNGSVDEIVAQHIEDELDGPAAGRGGN